MYRPVSEVYIPLPDSKNFHDERPDFFGPGIGTFEPGSKNWPCPKKNEPLNYASYLLVMLSTPISTKKAGKAIQSTDKQEILGNWILRGVFQLKEREVLTGQRLNELEIKRNSIDQILKMGRSASNSSGLIPKTHHTMPSVG